ncbi:nitric oxide reductase transcriptional regulator NorR [bacterium]|nr:nitric oxide reductase transcriptional regulator NorR [bacterium]
MSDLSYLLKIAVDLNATLSNSDRYERILEVVKNIIPCNAAAILIKNGNFLSPLSAFGLCPEALTKNYPIEKNPRLQIILNSQKPILFPLNTNLPDPFDGLVEGDPNALKHVHACLGCPLIVENEVIGALTADSLEPHAFDNLDFEILQALGSLAGASLRTSKLIETLEKFSQHQTRIVEDLVQTTKLSRGIEISGESKPIKELKEKIKLVAKSDLSVLVTGETGSGKELVARSIHHYSNRGNKPMIYVNCAALPESVAESELFGHTKGAFTGADRERSGKFEIADGGTIFLDEIGELPLTLQPKLLRILQEGEIQRVGSDKMLKVDVRVIAATNRDLEEEVKNNKFRADLFHRLNVFPIKTPPLRERLEDIPLLVGMFCFQNQSKYGYPNIRLSQNSYEKLKKYSWYGNVRELKNVISAAILKTNFRSPNAEVLMIEAQDLGEEFFKEVVISETNLQSEAKAETHTLPILHLSEATKEFQKNLILQAVEKAEGNWAKASNLLGIHRSNLFNLAKRLGLK